MRVPPFLLLSSGYRGTVGELIDGPGVRSELEGWRRSKEVQKEKVIARARVQIARGYPLQEQEERTTSVARGVRRVGTGGREGDGRRRKKEFANSTGGCPENTLDVWRHLGSFFFSLFFSSSPSSPPPPPPPLPCARGSSWCFCFFAHTNSSRGCTGCGVPGTRVENEAVEPL